MFVLIRYGCYCHRKKWWCSIGCSAPIVDRGATFVAGTAGQGRGIVFIHRVATSGGTVAKSIGIDFSISVGIAVLVP